MRIKGKIISWNDDRGYGFVSPFPEGDKIFVHISAFANRRCRPEIDQLVTYSVGADDQGRPCATQAILAGDRPHPGNKKSNGTFSIVFATLFFAIVLLSVLAEKMPSLVLAVYVGLSLLTYFVYAMDKAAAQNDTWRTPENTLHLFTLAGGWPGALLAQQRLRHKSRKQPFRVIF